MNDIVLELDKTRMLLYADDMVIFYAHREFQNIQDVLNNEFHRIGTWLLRNQLIINLKPGKTEAMLIGTPQKLSKVPNLQVCLNGVEINTTEKYEYLGTVLDTSLNFKHHLDKMCKKATSRVKLLCRIRTFISPHVAESIYSVMIRPLLLTCDVDTLLANSIQKKLQSVQNRCHKIVYGRKANNCWKSIKTLCKEQVCLKVHKSLNGYCPDLYVGYFDKIEHHIRTRGNGKTIRLPRVRSENGRKTFAFQGGLVFNDLPSKLATEKNFVSFKNSLKKHFDI